MTYDSVAHTLKIKADWSDLIGATTVAHIHCCTAAPSSGTVGVAVTPGTLPGFPAGTTAGSYDVTIDLSAASSYTAGFLAAGGGTVAGAEILLITGFDDRTAYFNIHSEFAPGGEIRGFLTQVPEPATIGLLALGLAGMGLSRRKQA